MNLYRSNKKGGTTPTGNKAITINSVGTTSGIDVANYATASVTTDGLYKPSGIKDNSGSSYTTNGTKTITGLENYAGVKINIDVPTGGSLNPTTLWTNSSPSSSFAAQDVTVSSMSSYFMIEVEFQFKTSISSPVPKSAATLSYLQTTSTGKSTVACVGGLTDSAGANYWRFWHYVNSTTLHFDGGKYNAGGSVSTANSALIPVRVIGYK